MNFAAYACIVICVQPAIDLLEEMSEAGLAMDAFTYAHAIEACCNGGNRVSVLLFWWVYLLANEKIRDNKHAATAATGNLFLLVWVGLSMYWEWRAPIVSCPRYEAPK